MKANLKSANVSWSVNPVCKTLSVPLVTEKYSFGTAMGDPVWKHAVTASDFVRFPEPDTPERETLIALFRNETHLVIGFFFEEKEEERTHLPANFTSLWHGDVAELHFGSLEPEPWLLQLVVGIDGNRFDSAGSYPCWEVSTFSGENGWGAELRLRLEMFRLTEGGFRFNFVRESLKRKERIVWSPLQIQYHEVPNFGELLFCSYAQAAFLHTGKTVPETLSRKEFELLRTQWEIPATKVVHGPFLSCPDKNSVCITWKTAGKVPAYIKYRVKGSETEPILQKCSCSGGILAYESIHFIQLEGLMPDTEYEYRIFSLFPVTGKEEPAGELRTFRTLRENGKNYSFFCITDIHSNADFLRKALQMQEAKSASFQVSLGDNLSYASGIDGIFDGIIDPLVEAQQSGSRDIPLVFVRGNHEELGVYAAEYFNSMRHPSGKTWYTFSQGDVFFIVLDSGDDKADAPSRPFFVNTPMFAEELEFLEQVVVSEAYCKAAFRVVLMHIPPLSGWPLQRAMTEPLQHASVLPDLMLCGHEHREIRRDAGDPDGLPFPIFVCSDKNVLSCSFSADSIQIKVLDPEKNAVTNTISVRN